VGDQSQPAEGALVLDAGGEIVGQGDDLVRRREDELPGVQDERFVALGVPVRMLSVRHEALLFRTEVEDHRRFAVVAAR
jgi:hypothetical protein